MNFWSYFSNYSVPFVGQDKGIDGNKKINGRKHHIAVDINGCPLVVYVGAANQSRGGGIGTVGSVG